MPAYGMKAQPTKPVSLQVYQTIDKTVFVLLAGELTGWCLSPTWWTITPISPQINFTGWPSLHAQEPTMVLALSCNSRVVCLQMGWISPPEVQVNPRRASTVKRSLDHPSPSAYPHCWEGPVDLSLCAFEPSWWTLGCNRRGWGDSEEGSGFWLQNCIRPRSDQP